MSKYARFGTNPNARTGMVVEIITAPAVIGGNTYQLVDLYTAEFITWLRQAPDDLEIDIEAGDSYDAPSDTWSKAP